MLGNDRRHVELAYALQFSLRGTPVLRYGEEIGMGEDLTQDGRNAIRTPMQWSFLPNGGFSTAPEAQLVRKVISEGEFGYPKVNVTAQRHDPKSLLSWFERMPRWAVVRASTSTWRRRPACWCTAATTPPARWCLCTICATSRGWSI
jgi:maltose alpha-D-glucosyltransferase/alpha-amylase